MKIIKVLASIVAVLALGMAMMADAATIRVTGGAWYLGNKVTATNFILGTAASMSGNGEIRAPATLAGTVSPGNSTENIGTLSFSDTVAFDSGSFVCYAATDTSLDRISVTGNVTGAATVSMTRAAGVAPFKQIIIKGGTASDYDSFEVSPSSAWVLGEMSALDLVVSYGQLPPAPQNVTASDGRYAKKVALSWSTASAATGYQVWRHTANDSSAATLIGTATQINYNDADSASGVIYYYWIKATNSIGASAFSSSDSGWRRSVGYTHYIDIDIDGDGKMDLVLFDPATGTWYAKLSSFGYALVSGVLGGPGCTPVPGDYDGDGLTDPGVYEELTGLWTVMLSSLGYGTATATLGGMGYTPVPENYDSDNRADVAVYNTANGNWTVLLSASSYITATLWGFGGEGYTPVLGDFDGDSRADPTIYQESTGNWYAKLSVYQHATTTLLGFGGTGDSPVPGDYDGDGLSDPALYNESTGNWYVMLSSMGYGIATATFGGSGYTALPGDYDGDGLTDPGVYHTTTGEWYVMLSSMGYGIATATFGGEGYDPVGFGAIQGQGNWQSTGSPGNGL